MFDLLILVTIIVTFFFSFFNGFSDAANAISTIIATRVLSPIKAVALSAVGNFIGMFFGVAVATTIGKGIVQSNIVTAELVLAAIVGGMIWDVLTYYLALPVSESHVLIGGLVGAGVAAGGWSAVQIQGVVDKVLVPMVASPTIALIVGFLLTALIIRFSYHYTPTHVNRYFRRLQIVSSLFFSVTHGTNDAQKAMGIITVLLVSYGYLASFDVPLWVIIGAHAAISLGTFFGGWRIVKTMGFRITDLQPYQGFAAETGGALILAGTATMGFPVSTTHAISGSIMGVGATRRLSAVRWGIARRISVAWVLTMPASAFFAYLVYQAIGFIIV
ncbi:MAG: inorganic phosphate transporter [Thaumarchaeota archaeon]|nr:inorganic phosphate transporter [Nitrososphaerota archaeon]MCL5316986.1 inorganic phosphate transporter [Nitrososphaerota archaeon]